jgi:hypothetical protein
MSDIVLSASVRQNLLSLQSTADLLSTTQNRLATGKKVNTALDNPTNYFTAASLDNRASDISNLLDGIGNGVQVLQAANTGITSLQKLVDSAKSVANQALQATVGYSTKSSISTTITGATADNLLGTTTAATAGTYTAAANFAAVDVSATGGSASAATITEANNSFTAPLNVAGTGSTLAGTGTYAAMDFSGAGTLSFDLSIDTGQSAQNISIAAADITSAGGTASATTSQADVVAALNAKINSVLGTTGVTYAAANGTKIDISSGDNKGSTASVQISNFAATATGTSTIADGTGTAGASTANLHFDLTIDSAGSPTTVTIDQDAVNAYNTANSTSLDASSLSGADVADLINDQITGGTVSYSSANAALSFTSSSTGTTSDLTIANTGTAGGATNTTGVADHTLTAGSPAGADASLTFNLTLDGAGSPTAITIDAAHVTSYNSAHTTSLDPANLSGADIANLINEQAGSTVASFAAGKLTFTSTTQGATSSVVVGAVTTAGGATDTTGIGTGGSNTGAAANGGLSAKTLHFDAIGNGSAVDITFGDGTAGTVKTLNDLNAKLSANNLLATIDNSGKLTITTTNDAASQAIGAVTGTATDTGEAFNGVSGGTTAGTGGAPTQDAAALATRANLVAQYNNILDQITSTSQDSSFNGVNLLNGDQLKLTFNETGKSTLKIQGVTFNAAGLGLSSLTAGTDFIDNESANNVIANLDKASSTLRTEASALGSNLSIVQIRQDFSKNLINVLQTGSSNLTLADTNEEAANSQALSTRQSIAVSALALANQSQQSVLQLLR